MAVALEVIDTSIRDQYLDSTCSDKRNPLKYVYRSLDDSLRSFRLAILHPGSSLDPLKCSIHHARLDAVPAYHTVSYSWGNASDQADVELDGMDCIVPETAAAALRRIRLPQLKRHVWIDAVCIDQANRREREDQVSIMRKIYSQSCGNIVFLGPSDYLTASALRSIELIIGNIREETDDCRSLHATLYGQSGERRYSKTRLDLRVDEKALSNLFARPWFSRVWIVQEVALAPSNTCFIGSFTANLDDILMAAAWLQHKVSPLLATGDFDGIVGAVNLFSLVNKEYGRCKTITTPSLFDLVRMARSRNTTEPRDRIYGLLGLSRWSVNAEELPITIRPKYNEPISNVLRDATICMVEDAKGRIDPIQYVSHRSIEDFDSSEYPTWVPRWDRWYTTEDPQVLISFFEANLGGLDTHFEDDSNVLVVSGFNVGCITETTQTLIWKEADDLESVDTFIRSAESIFNKVHEVDDPGTSEYKNETKDILDLRASGPASAKLRLTGRFAISEILADLLSVGDCFIATLMAGANAEAQLATTDDFAAMSDFMQLIRDEQMLPPALKDLGPQTQTRHRAASRFEDAFRNACDSRRLFRTDSTCVGLGPQITQEGDILVLLHANPMPVVLRPRKGGYGLVGECYVEGIMGGFTTTQYRKEGRPGTVYRVL